MRYKIIVNPEYNYLGEFIENIPKLINEGNGKIIYNKRNKVIEIKTNDETKVVVKKFKVPLFHQRLDYTFIRKSKAKRAYLFGLRLFELNINTPKPIACIEGYKYGIFHTGYFVSLPCYDKDFKVLINDTQNEELINALVNELVYEHEKGFLHGDPNLSNYLFRKDNEKKCNEYVITTIDINRSSFISNPSQKQCLKRLVRLTHVRPLLIKIIEIYANHRGWDTEKCKKYVIKHLDCMERKNKLKKLFKKRR